MEEHAAAMEARLAAIGELSGRLCATAEEVYKVLWPDLPVPETPLWLAKWLAAAPGRVDEWRASAARGGAEMALSFMLSWYAEVRLDQLATRRAGSQPDLEPLFDDLHARADTIASYVDTDEFIPSTEGEESEASEGEEDDDAGGAGIRPVVM